MLHHYTDLREVTRPYSPGEVLAASSAKSVSAGVLAAYNSYDDLSLACIGSVSVSKYIVSVKVSVIVV